MSSTETGFQVIGEVRQPPRRSRQGRYTDVYAALDVAKSKGPAWVALAAGDKDAVSKVRNAVSRQVQEDLAWHTSIHEEEDAPDTFTLFVKYDKGSKRLARKPRGDKTSPELAEAKIEDRDDAWLEAQTAPDPAPVAAE